MSFLGTISNTFNNRVTNKPLEETVAELKTDIVSKERQLQAKTEQLQERNEYILQLEEQLRRVEATNQIPIPPESSNEQQRIETVNAKDENARNTHHSPQLPLPDNIPHQEELTYPKFPAPQLQKKTSLDIFKPALFARFKPYSPINKDLPRIQQNPNEGVEEYFCRVQKLATDSNMDELVVTELAKDGLHERLRELVKNQRPTTLGELMEQAILAEQAINIKRSTSNIIPDAESRTKSDVDALLVAATLVAMMNIMPANAAQQKQDQKVDAVYSSRPHHHRSSNNQWPRSIGPILRCGGKS